MGYCAASAHYIHKGVQATLIHPGYEGDRAKLIHFFSKGFLDIKVAPYTWNTVSSRLARRQRFTLGVRHAVISRNSKALGALSGGGLL